MAYTLNRSQQLVEAHKHGYFAQKASLQSGGVELPQHNVDSKGKKPAKKTQKKAESKTAKKTAAASTSAAKKTTAKKTAAKKSTKKS
jgi:hypothetical protein